MTDETNVTMTLDEVTRQYFDAATTSIKSETGTGAADAAAVLAKTVAENKLTIKLSFTPAATYTFTSGTTVSIASASASAVKIVGEPTITDGKITVTVEFAVVADAPSGGGGNP